MSKSRLLLILFGLAAVFILGLMIGVVVWRSGPTAPPAIANTATVLKQVQGLSQLVSVKYVLEKVVILEDPKRIFGVEMPGGDNRVWLLAHGIVKAGIDLEQLKENDIHASGAHLTVTLPPPIVTDVYLDEHRTKVLDRTTGLLRTFNKDLEQDARRQAIGEISHAARELGITKEAEDRVRVQLINLFHQLGFTDVEIKSR